MTIKIPKSRSIEAKIARKQDGRTQKNLGAANVDHQEGNSDAASGKRMRKSLVKQSHNSNSALQVTQTVTFEDP